MDRFRFRRTSGGALAAALLAAFIIAAAPTRAAGIAPPHAPLGSWSLPVAGTVVRGFDPPSSRYGAGHLGVDFAIPAGAPVRASGTGVVTFAGMVAGTLHVVVVHTGNLRTSYSFLATATVHRGDAVERGDVIGTTGGPTGKHPPGFHFGLRLGNEYVDPMLLFRPTDLSRVVHLAPVTGEHSTASESWAVEALGVWHGLDISERAAPNQPGAHGSGGGVLGSIGSWLEGAADTGATIARSLPGASGVEAAADRLAASARAWRNCTASPPEADGSGGSGHLLMAVGGINSSTDPETGATFGLPPEALGYRADEVHWYSYAPDGGAYAAADTHGRIHGAAERLAEQLRALQRSEPGREVDLVAHSQGGVVVDEFLQHLYDAADPTFPPLGTVVTLSSPHQGAPLATAAHEIATTDSGKAALGVASGAGLPGTRARARGPARALTHDPRALAAPPARPGRLHDDRRGRRRRRTRIADRGARSNGGGGEPEGSARSQRRDARCRIARRSAARARGPTTAVSERGDGHSGCSRAAGDHPPRARRGSRRARGRTGSRHGDRGTAVRTVVRIVSVALLGALVVGCGSGRPSERSTEPLPPGRVRVRVDWSQPVTGWPSQLSADRAGVVAVSGGWLVSSFELGNGTRKWETKVGGQLDPFMEPAIDVRSVLVSAGDRFVVLDRADGAIRWEVPTGADAGAAGVALVPTHDGTVAVTAVDDGNLVGRDEATGAPIWSIAREGSLDAHLAVAAASETVVAIWRTADAATVRAFDAASGAVRWEQSVGPMAASPAVAGDLVIVAAGDGDYRASVRAFGLADGRPRWTTPVPASFEPDQVPGVDADPATGAGVVGVQDHLGTVSLLDLPTGAVRWQTETGVPALGGRVLLTSEAVVVRTEGQQLVILDRARGGVRARRTDPDGLPEGIASVGDRVLVGWRWTEPGRIDALELDLSHSRP